MERLKTLAGEVDILTQQLALINPASDPENYAAGQINLGTKYYEVATITKAPAALADALKAYDAAEAAIGNAVTHTFGTLKMNQAYAHQAMAKHGQTEHVTLALEALDAAQAYFTKSEHPKDWAELEYHRGRSFMDLGRNTKDLGLIHKAIDAQSAALEMLDTPQTQQLLSDAHMNKSLAAFYATSLQDEDFKTALELVKIADIHIRAAQDTASPNDPQARTDYLEKIASEIARVKMGIAMKLDGIWPAG